MKPPVTLLVIAAILGLVVLDSYLGGTLLPTETEMSLQQKAEAGDPEALFFHAGNMAQEENRDEEAIKNLLYKSAKGGYPPAQYFFGQILLEEGKTEQAIAWIKKAAENDFEKAQMLIAAMALNQTTTTNDMDAIRNWLEDAASNESVEATFLLGVSYFEGRWGEADWEKAIPYIQEAAQSGYGPGEYMLAGLYLTGAGIEKNRDKARLWFERSQEHGVPDKKNMAAMLGMD